MKRFWLMGLCLAISSCEENGGSGTAGGGGTVSQSTVLRIGLFSAQNGASVSGQIEILRDNSTMLESMETKNDFVLSGLTGSVQFWLTDNAGSVNIKNSSKKAFLDSLASNYSGAHTFPIPAGYKSGDYTYVVVFGSAANMNLGNAKLVLPILPTDDI